jgi:NAD(P)H-nitrite reductase large subunit
VSEGPDTVICACNGVTRGRIEAAIEDGGLSHVDQVSRATGAATGCGGCANSVAALLRGTQSDATADEPRPTHQL